VIPLEAQEREVEYRRDVDGLRGVAVLLVVLVHAWPELLPGGFVGVDVFFVISGFVVARMVGRQLEAGRFTARSFFLRRINRLAPALLTSVAATLAIALWWGSPSIVLHVTVPAAAGLAMVANLLAGAQSSYFDAIAETRPLIHLWSLGVEEQFYLSVPIAVWAATKWPRARRGLLVGFAVASLVACVLVTRSSSKWAFYLPFTRAWELLAGVWLAGQAARFESMKRSRLDALGVLGLLLVLASSLLLGRGAIFPGAWALFPVVGAVAVVAAGPQSLVGRALSVRPLVGIGLISYPLYLWHWPVLTLLRLATPEAQHVVSVPVGVLIAFGLAWATTRFLERPVRARQSRRVALTMFGVGAALATALLTSHVVLDPEQWAFRRPEWAALMRFVKDFDSVDPRLGTCMLAENKLHDAASCIEMTPPGLPLVYVWGDSFAGRLAIGLRLIQGERHSFRLAQRTRASCQPLLEEKAWCGRGNNALLEEVLDVKPDIIVLHAMWSSPTFRPAEFDRTLGTLVTKVPKSRILVVGQPPHWGVGLPWVLTRRLGGERLPERVAPPRIALQRQEEATLAKIAASHGVSFLSAIDAFCTLDDACLVKLADEPLMLTTWDMGHLTAPAAHLLARRVAMTW
jgi:peptidoglycan/LPS O-acetylase OafA/YrhL